MINSKSLIDKVEEFYAKKTAERSFSAFLNEYKLSDVDDYDKVKYAYKAAVFDREKALYSGDEKTAKEKDAEAARLKVVLDKITSSVPGESPSYECELCKDTGRLENGYCKCFLSKVISEAYAFLGLKRPHLKSFEDDVFSAVNKTETLKNKLIEYADDFSKREKNIYLCGGAGAGKTFYAQCVTDRLEKNGFTPLFLTAFELNDIATGMFKKSASEKTLTDDILSTCDLLVIDDLGSEPVYGKVTVEKINTIVTRRSELKKPLFITTNLMTDEILSRYGERIFSRITGKNTVILQLNGKDLRKM